MRSGIRVLASLCLVTGCASSRGTTEPWVYAISRSAYGGIGESVGSQRSRPHRDGSDAIGYVIVLVMPFALDTALLPVTIPHDLLFVK